VPAAEEFLALSIVFVVHVVGGLMLVWGILDDEGREPWRRRWRRGGGGAEPPPDPSPSPGGDPATLPLPLRDAAASRVRLREDGRLADGYPPPARRPADPAPARAPARRHD
jgi:hypothetical protein